MVKAHSDFHRPADAESPVQGFLENFPLGNDRDWEAENQHDIQCLPFCGFGSMNKKLP